ncbi:MAG: hypothetical protein U1E97_05770 [Alphaproteobacteria bacterium]
MAIVEDQTATIAFLACRETHGGAATTRIDTHGAVVVLAGERAYKLKRAVRFPYMDFSTAEIRRRMCEGEIRLNRRTAPMLYLGVAPILAGPGGTLTLGPVADLVADRAPDGAVDYVVVMRRFDSAAQFDSLAADGALDEALMPDLAETIARFHAGAQIRPEHGRGRHRPDRGRPACQSGGGGAVFGHCSCDAQDPLGCRNRSPRGAP